MGLEEYMPPERTKSPQVQGKPPIYGYPSYRGIRNSIVVSDMVPAVPGSPTEVIAKEESDIYTGLRMKDPHAVIRAFMNLAPGRKPRFPIYDHGRGTSSNLFRDMTRKSQRCLEIRIRDRHRHKVFVFNVDMYKVRWYCIDDRQRFRIHMGHHLLGYRSNGLSAYECLRRIFSTSLILMKAILSVGCHLVTVFQVGCYIIWCSYPSRDFFLCFARCTTYPSRCASTITMRHHYDKLCCFRALRHQLPLFGCEKELYKI